MIAVPGARRGLGVYVRLQVPQHNLNSPAFHRPRERAVRLSLDTQFHTYFPFVVSTSLLFIPAATGFSITQVSQLSCYRLQNNAGKLHGLAVLICPSHNRANRAVMLTFTAL